MAQFVNRPTTNDVFDWGSPPDRKALLEIELSQDEAARRLANQTNTNADVINSGGTT